MTRARNTGGETPWRPRVRSVQIDTFDNIVGNKAHVARAPARTGRENGAATASKGCYSTKQRGCFLRRRLLLRFEKFIQEAMEFLFEGLELHPRCKFVIAGKGASIGRTRLPIGFLICLFPTKERTDSIDETMPI